MQRQIVVMDVSRDPAAFREYWKRTYGPVIAVYTFNAADSDRVAALHRDFLELLTAWNRSDTSGRTAYPAEYLLFHRPQAVTPHEGGQAGDWCRCTTFGSAASAVARAQPGGGARRGRRGIGRRSPRHAGPRRRPMAR